MTLFNASIQLVQQCNHVSKAKANSKSILCRFIAVVQANLAGPFPALCLSPDCQHC